MMNSEQKAGYSVAEMQRLAAFNQPAYPFDQRDDAGNRLEQWSGSTKREVVATAMLAAIVSAPFMESAIPSMTEVAVKLADALLLELSK